jgi:hypothetical protein
MCIGSRAGKANYIVRIGGATMKSSDLIAVSTFRSRADAQKAKRILDEAGIDSIVQPDPRYFDPDRDSRDGRYPHSDYTQIMVRAEDAGKAGEALQRRNRRSG